ncbi:predicted membrane protein [Longilinea arvoryzae]|uniref:Predicted membrane protein n=1 Tax=Longilinea arvoryzae TaxID=360412 RepID=A0A0S7BHQ4_9CHLR|nr:PrsW family glutamic-type intramembrane protease [Longilinea arvoryzae]GAP13666.1 predicted membrane protein [Longilinea arvoryzae]
MQIIALLIASLIPLLALYLIYKLDLYKTGNFRSVLICFLAGVVGFWAASMINRTTISLGWLPRTSVVRYSAPVVEEICKGLVLLYLVRRPNFTYFVEGAIYGFAAGIGFAIFENYQYILAARDAGLSVAIGRVLSTNLIHATTCGLLGIALGLARFQRGFRVALVSLAGLMLAMLLHIGFNNLVTRVNSGLLLVYAAICGLGGAGIIALAIRRGLKEEKVWIEETLGMDDRVTVHEANAVQSIQNVHEILKPLAQRFGDKKAAQIERFLIIQARLGILRKSLEKLNDERMKRSVEEQMARLRIEMDAARRDVGSYAMLYLRYTFPEDASPLWGRLETAIQEKAAARPATGGINLWANLQSRQAEKKSETPAPSSDTPAS